MRVDALACILWSLAKSFATVLKVGNRKPEAPRVVDLDEERLAGPALQTAELSGTSAVMKRSVAYTDLFWADIRTSAAKKRLQTFYTRPIH